MELLFWMLILLFAYMYFGYPLVLTVLAVFVRRNTRTLSILPPVTFLITARNEARNIRQKLENTLALDYPRDRFEIVVASDASDDGTDELVLGYAARGVRLFRAGERCGKTETQNRAVRQVSGDVVIFSDATTMYEKSAVKNIVRNFGDPSVGGVSGRFKYVDPGETGIGTGTAAFWDYESFIKRRQSRIGTITGCSGCIYAVRRDLYVPLPADIISDLVEPLKILEKGYRIVYEHDALAYETAFTKPCDEFAMRVRVITRGMRGFLYVSRLLNPLRYGFISFQILSHKILRWFSPFFAAALFLVSAALAGKAPVYMVFLYGQAAFYCLALTGWLFESLSQRMKVFSLPLYFCLINLASVVALVRILRDKKDVFWETVRE